METATGKSIRLVHDFFMSNASYATLNLFSFHRKTLSLNVVSIPSFLFTDSIPGGCGLSLFTDSIPGGCGLSLFTDSILGGCG